MIVRKLTAAAGTLAVAAAFAQADYPSRPVRIVVPFPPGGTTDIVGRITAEALGKAFAGKAAIVENIPGAGGTVGTDRVAKAVADGHTLLIATLAANATAPSVYPRLPYDPIKDFAYVAPLAWSSNVLVINSKLPVNSVRELIGFAKANPGKLAYSSPGVGISNHLAMELFLKEAGIDALHVPYKGSGQATTAVIAGEVQMSLDPIASSLGHLRSGALRAIGVSSRARAALLPEIPTIGEGGVRDVEAYTWNGLAAPAGTPRAIIDQLHAAVTSAFKAPEIRERFVKMGVETIEMSPTEFQGFIQREAAKWGDVARRVGAKVE